MRARDRVISEMRQKTAQLDASNAAKDVQLEEAEQKYAAEVGEHYMLRRPCTRCNRPASHHTHCSRGITH